MDMIDPHVRMIRPVTPSANGCEDCLRIGGRWLHLRLCLTRGHVGCCDSSPNRHARKHFHATGHPIIQSFEPGEDWRWCYVDERKSERKHGKLECWKIGMVERWKTGIMHLKTQYSIFQYSSLPQYSIIPFFLL
jgi:hypothetical protein